MGIKFTKKRKMCLKDTVERPKKQIFYFKMTHFWKGVCDESLMFLSVS